MKTNKLRPVTVDYRYEDVPADDIEEEMPDENDAEGEYTVLGRPVTDVEAIRMEIGKVIARYEESLQDLKTVYARLAGVAVCLAEVDISLGLEGEECPF